jgi:hypothetical protein
MKALTLPILRNGQHLLFTPSKHGALQELQVAGQPCLVPPDAVCIRWSTGDQMAVQVQTMVMI